MTPSLLFPARSVWLSLPTATERLCHLEPGSPVLALSTALPARDRRKIPSDFMQL